MEAVEFCLGWDRNGLQGFYSLKFGISQITGTAWPPTELCIVLKEPGKKFPFLLELRPLSSS